MSQRVSIPAWTVVAALFLVGCQKSEQAEKSKSGPPRTQVTITEKSAPPSSAAADGPAKSSAAPTEKTAPVVAKTGGETPVAKTEATVTTPTPAAKTADLEPIATHFATPAYMPKLALSAKHAETCLVNVGQAMPDLPLKDHNGSPRSLAKTFGERLTVVYFYDGHDPWRDAALGDLAEIAAHFGSRGVRVAAVNVGGSNDEAKHGSDQVQGAFPVLVDGDRSAFAQIAKSQLPRVYVLGPQGKIEWFDIGYGVTTHEYIVQAVRFLTTKG